MHIFVNLLRGRVVIGPVGLGREAVGVVMGRDVAFATGISIEVSYCLVDFPASPIVPVLEPSAT